MRRPWMLMPVRQTRSASQTLVEVDVLDILVDQRHVVMIGHESGKQSEARNRQVGALAEKRHAMLHAPEGRVEARINDDDIGHWSLPAAQPRVSLAAHGVAKCGNARAFSD